MKTPLLSLAAAALFALPAAPSPAGQPAKVEPKPEALPEFPRLDPKNTVELLDKESKAIYGEFARRPRARHR